MVWCRKYLYPITVIVYCSLNKEECEQALLPTLEHASLVHSHIHHPGMDATVSPDTFEQTRNAIIYISVSTYSVYIIATFYFHTAIKPVRVCRLKILVYVNILHGVWKYRKT
jgi:hypothetical protein